MTEMLASGTPRHPAPGEYSNGKRHTLGDMRATVIEKVRSQNPIYRKEREAHHIIRFNTFY